MDYSDYKVHKTFPSTYVGDEIIAVLKNGNKGQIRSLKAQSGIPLTFEVKFSEDGMCEVDEREVDHYLTPKPKQLPTHPGLWKDKDGDIWVYESHTFANLRCIRGVYPDGSPDWTAHGVQSSVVECKNLALFTELEVKEKEQ